jgi:hypothetical protein
VTILRLSLLAIVACLLSSVGFGASRSLEETAAWNRLTFTLCAPSDDAKEGVMAGDATAIEDNDNDNDDGLADDATDSLRVDRPETPISRNGAGHRTGLRASLGFADCPFRPPRATA